MSNTTITAHADARVFVTQKRFIIMSIDPYNRCSVAESPAVHSSLTSAQKECARLAALKPRTMFVAMQLTAGSVSSLTDNF